MLTRNVLYNMLYAMLSIRLEQAMAEAAKMKRLHKVPEPRGSTSITHSLHRAHWDDVHRGGSWFACGRASLPSSPRRGWRARDSGGPARPDVRKRAGCARVGWCQIWRKRSPKPTQRAGLACLAAPEICVKRRASDAQFGEQPSQRK